MEIKAENSHAEKLDKCLLRMYNDKRFAGVLELADETDSKSVAREGVWVRPPSPAPNRYDPNLFPRRDGFGFFQFFIRKRRYCHSKIE